jgi:hypothetical protein
MAGTARWWDGQLLSASFHWIGRLSVFHEKTWNRDQKAFTKNKLWQAAGSASGSAKSISPSGDYAVCFHDYSFQVLTADSQRLLQAVAFFKQIQNAALCRETTTPSLR